jgi:apolipoprotein N-acyltransferase
MVVWTETAIRTSLRPNFIQASPYHMRIRRLVQELGVPFIIGSPDNWTVRAEDGEVREGVNPETLDEIYPTKEEIWTNSAYLVAPDGEIVEKYDKIQLTPFGEHFPLGQKVRFLGRILENFTDSADFTPGDEYTVFKYGDIPFSTVICWEGAYGYYIRRFVNNGADFMLNISNDMWSGTHAGHFQHFNMTKFRPIENRIWYARAGNDGVTGMIPIKKTGYLIGEVGPRIRETFYTRHGNILPAASLAVIVLALGFGIFLLVTGRRDALRETDRVSEALRNWASGAAGARSSYTGGGAGLPRITDGHRRRRGRGPGTAGRKG